MLCCASSFVTAAYAKYASFLMIRTPCLRLFYDAVCKWSLLRLFTSPSIMCPGFFPADIRTALPGIAENCAGEFPPSKYADNLGIY